jgi:hypothetical protein
MVHLNTVTCNIGKAKSMWILKQMAHVVTAMI